MSLTEMSQRQKQQKRLMRSSFLAPAPDFDGGKELQEALGSHMGAPVTRQGSGSNEVYIADNHACLCILVMPSENQQVSMPTTVPYFHCRATPVKVSFALSRPR